MALSALLIINFETVDLNSIAECLQKSGLKVDVASGASLVAYPALLGQFHPYCRIEALPEGEELPDLGPFPLFLNGRAAALMAYYSDPSVLVRVGDALAGAFGLLIDDEHLPLMDWRAYRLVSQVGASPGDLPSG